jgi:hypothetical protein
VNFAKLTLLSFVQVESLENAQSKTVSEVTELKNQHNLARRKLERIEDDLGKWKAEREAMTDEAQLKKMKVKLEKEQREKELEVRLVNWLLCCMLFSH